MLICLFYFRKIPDKNIRLINNVNLGMFIVLFISLAVAPFDTNGTFLKFYPFRLASLALFFIIIQAALWFAYSSGQPARHLGKVMNFAGSIMVIFCIFLLLRGLNFSIRRTVKNYRKLPPLLELTGYIREKTPPEALFYRHGDIENSFARRSGRDIFVDYKFVPAGGTKLYEWYVRMKTREKVYRDLGHLDVVRADYGIDYLVARDRISHLERNLVYENGAYLLYLLD